MKLHFLGASYNHSPRTIDTVESKVTGKFLGSTYKKSRPVLVRPPKERNFKYRGVAYSN